MILYTLPCQVVHAGFPFLPVMDLSTLGVTRWKVLTPLRLELRVRAAQSMGECPGERSTLPRALGMLTAPLGVSPPFGDRPPFTRCWLFAGIPLFGRGPVDGTRREAAALGGGAKVGRGGGGIMVAEVFCAGARDFLGD